MYPGMPGYIYKTSVPVTENQTPLQIQQNEKRTDANKSESQGVKP